ncbi:MAG: putative bifunctional diguanylate cyclase/phosphodiesterase [Actinomycetes bacterium]
MDHGGVEPGFHCMEGAEASDQPVEPRNPILVVDAKNGGRRELTSSVEGLRAVVAAANEHEAETVLRQAGGAGLVVVAAGDLGEALAAVARLRAVPGCEGLPGLLLTPDAPTGKPDDSLPAGVDVLPVGSDPAEVRRHAALLLSLDAASRETRRQTEQVAAARRQWRRDLVETPVPTALVHPGDSTRICGANGAFASLVGGAPADWSGRRLTLRVHREDAQAVEEAVALVSSGQETRREASARWVSADLRTVRSEVTVARVEWPPAPRTHLRVQVVVTSPAERPEDTARPGSLDTLTGLPDRRLMLRHLRYALGRARRRETPVAVVAIDLDEFAAYEAARGRDLADRLVVQVANRLGAVLRPGDVVCRLGRDSFGLICEDVGSEAVSRHIAERVRLAVRAVGLPGEDTPAGLTASVGLAVSDPQDEHEQLLWRAEEALRRAKEGGRDRTVTRPDTLDDPAEEMRRRLRVALDADVHGGQAERFALDDPRAALSLHYQPVVDLAKRQVVGVEALLRLRDPDQGFVMPDEFLPAAEYGEEIARLAAWTLDEACAQMARWTNEHAGLTVSVNLSSRQLTGADVVDLTRARLARHGLPAHALRVEVAESDLLDKAGHVHRAVSGLAALGVDVAVDRFGTGASSLTSLRGMPVSTLKVDASLVNQVAASREGSAVVAALLTLGRALGMRTIGVGVETDEQEEVLRALGCDDAQGYHLGAPRSAQQIGPLLTAAL